MQQLTFLKPGRLEWRDVRAPELTADTDALVRPLAVARCDLDVAILRGEAPFRGALLHFLRNHLPDGIGQNGIFHGAPFKGPYAFGHETVAEVIAVGDAVRTVRPGERVIVAFQISCGSCRRCRRGLTNSCETVPPRSMYGFGELGGHSWGGMLADAQRVPFADHMLTPLPAGASPVALASAGDNLCDGYRTVAPHLRNDPDARVLVVGGGAWSVGLYAAATASALGASVDYVDDDEARRTIATRVGARALRWSERNGERYAVSVDASADPDRLAYALTALEPGGVCTSVGIYYTPTTPLPLRAMYGSGVTLITGRANPSADLGAALELVSSGRLDPGAVTTTVAAWDDAAEALLEPTAKVVVARPELIES